MLQDLIHDRLDDQAGGNISSARPGSLLWRFVVDTLPDSDGSRGTEFPQRDTLSGPAGW
jgi:hypothetical protein